MSRALRARSARELRAREHWLRIAVGVAVVAAIMVPAITAANVVPASKASASSHPVTANQLAPTQCKNQGLTNVVVGTNASGSANVSDLVLGTAGGDNLAGGGGNTFDCLVGGNGADRMNAGGGNDWCIGGGGVDVFIACENTDGLT